jgi:hypothetical protein
MSSPSFDETLVKRSTPWAACVALEAFFQGGGHCRVQDETNWVGIAYTCEMKSDDEPPDSPHLHHVLAWAYLAISIHESMATGYSEEDRWGIITGGMWVRTKMIVRCGDHLGDHICDCKRVVEWCLSTPQVKRFLEIENVPPFGSLAPEVRGVADMLTMLIGASRLEETGAVADFMAATRRARKTSSSKVP